MTSLAFIFEYMRPAFSRGRRRDPTGNDLLEQLEVLQQPGRFRVRGRSAEAELERVRDPARVVVGAVLLDTVAEFRREFLEDGVVRQVQGLQRMVEADAYCVDILLQVSAVQGALEQVQKLLLGRHIESCVAEAMRSGGKADRQQKIDELLEVFARFGAR